MAAILAAVARYHELVAGLGRKNPIDIEAAASPLIHAGRLRCNQREHVGGRH
jgi:hypothetical protein